MEISRDKIIEMLQTSYSMEIETVINYLANGTNLDGVRAEEIKKSLRADISEELTHAQQLADRIKELGGRVPGSASVQLGAQQQPPDKTTDVVGVIKAVIDAEEGACEQYRKIIKAADGQDYVTQDLCIALLADEEKHLTLFRGYLKEYQD